MRVSIWAGKSVNNGCSKSQEKESIIFYLVFIRGFGVKGWRPKTLDTVTCALPHVIVSMVVGEMVFTNL